MIRLALILTVAACSGPAPATPPSTPAPAPAPARAAAGEPKAPEAAPAPTEDMMEPCAAGTKAHEAAAKDLAALDARIKTLADDTDPAPINADLDALLATPCFAFADRPWDGVDADSARSLKAFWENGGQWWVASALDLAQTRSVTTAPTPRSTLRADHPLACPVGDSGCGRSTRAWRARAERTFELMAAARRLAALTDDDRDDPSEERCAAEAMKAEPNIRFSHWLNCVGQLPMRRAALPVGDTRAPDTGWLLVRGRRGHYSFCDEVRAYDLATGSAFVSRSCSGLALRSDGSVDGAQTDANRGQTDEIGMIPVTTLREAAWMILLSPEAQRVRDSETYPVPQGLKPALGHSRVGGGGFGSFMTSSNQTTLSWSYMVGDTAVFSGTLTWPNDYNDDARQYAVELLVLAEDSMDSGCARARPPKNLDFGLDEPGVSTVDADPDSLERAEQALRDAIARIKFKRCR